MTFKIEGTPAIRDAAAVLQMAEVEFATLEAQYFDGRIGTARLRDAWLERERARRLLEEAHWTARGAG